MGVGDDRRSLDTKPASFSNYPEGVQRQGLSQFLHPRVLRVLYGQPEKTGECFEKAAELLRSHGWPLSAWQNVGQLISKSWLKSTPDGRVVRRG
jgi:hypothetical protein